MQLRTRKLLTFLEDFLEDAGKTVDPPLTKLAIAAVVNNPYAGRYVEDLTPMITASEALGAQIVSVARKLSAFSAIQSYGKAAIVGVAGEQEHANALLTTTFATPLRAAVGGGKAWISSATKCGGPGTTIDVPLASKDALYVRSHYDTMSITLHDAPMPDEIVVIFCAATRGRVNARCGGLELKNIKGTDGLV